MKPSYCVLLLATLFAPCLSFSQQTIIDTIVSGGQPRYYRMYVPAGYTGQTPAPLVFNLHGYSSYAAEQEQYSGFNLVADTADLIVVYPNGTFNQGGVQFWNNTGNLFLPDDVAFISQLLDAISATYNIDPNRVYATGISQGGAMSYQLACQLDDRIAAVASVAGYMTAGQTATCAADRPVPILEIHGTADTFVPYTGGGPFSTPPMETTLNFWRTHNACPSAPVSEALPDLNVADSSTVERQVSAGCGAGSRVELLKITGGGHTWPSPLVISPWMIDYLGTTNYDINASVEIWNFFRQYRLDQLSPAEELHEAAAWSVSPNPARDFVLIQTSRPVDLRRITVVDALGRHRLDLAISGESNSVRLDVGSLPAGIYYVVVESAQGIRCFPVVLME